MAEALLNIKKHITLHKVINKKTKVTDANPIVDRYFTELKNKQKTVAIFNGYVLGEWNVMDNFVTNGHNYLRRTIKIWDDCIKLNYGYGPRDSPFLWHHMTTYVQDMAYVCDGFRLDNCHSTPIHVSQHML